MTGRGRLAARIVGWVIAAGTPPAVAVGVWQNFVGYHPVTAMALLGAYEALLAVVVFAGEIVGELRNRWRERIVDHVDRALRRRFSRFDRRYREYVLGSVRFTDLKGLATVGDHTPELDRVFVDVSLALRAPNQVREGLLADLPMEVTDRHSIGDFLDRPEAAVLAIVGVPGSGKTTLLQHTALQVCRARRGRRRTVPILLYLRDHVVMIVSTPDVALHELLRSKLGRYRDDEPPDWFEQRLRDGDCVVLLDGLDEVARQEDRRSVADWVEHQIRQYPKNDYVITSRPQGYRITNIDSATVLQVCSFSDDQVTRFVRGWYLAVEQHSTGKTGEDVRLRAESEADDLLKRLNDAPGLYDLTVNPLLLTMIATVHRYRGALPGSRADLYGEICQVMLWRRQEAKRLPIELNGDKKEGLLRGLAFAMMQQRVRDLPRTEVIDNIRPALRRMPQNLTADEFLTNIRSNGLLIERESGLYSFAHHTFQEYLAAAHIRDKGLHSVLAGAVDDPWWRETTLLYTARSDADPIVQACLDSTNVTALSLAFDCAEQNSELEPELRRRLDELLASAFEPHTNLEHRRLMTGVLVTRHLRHPIRTGNGGRVCTRPITTGLYQLYQQDTHGPAPEGLAQMELGKNEPIVGVRGSDAVAFARWVNAVIGTGITYRLPNLAEINDSAVQRTLTSPTSGTQVQSVWLEPENGNDQPWLWTPVGVDHPHAIDAATLVSHVKADIEHSTSTLTRLLLLRSITAVRILARVLPPDLDHARALAHDLNHTLDHTLDHALDHHHALDHMLDLNHALDLALDLDHTLDHALDHTLDLTLDLDLTRALDHALTRARNHARDLNHTLDLDHALDLDLDLTRALDLTLDFDRDRDHDLARAPARARARALARVAGSALSQALTRTDWKTSTATWCTNFSQAFIEATGIAETTYLVCLDALADRAHSGRETLFEVMRSPEDTVRSHSWADQVASNFEDAALPIFTRQHALTSDTATALRIAALCLAAEADSRSAHLVGNTFREIAAGITLLERRSNHQTAPTETILLAIIA